MSKKVKASITKASTGAYTVTVTYDSTIIKHKAYSLEEAQMLLPLLKKQVVINQSLKDIKLQLLATELSMEG